jgi:hypothetical protein
MNRRDSMMCLHDNTMRRRNITMYSRDRPEAAAVASSMAAEVAGIDIWQACHHPNDFSKIILLLRFLCLL